jgi:glycerol uptake facilitator-like aquaporin
MARSNCKREALAAEFLGAAFLLAAVVGSGIMAERLSNGNTAVALLANSIATGAMLFVLITVLGPASGAHFNPIVTVTLGWRNRTGTGEVMRYLAAQVSGALAGVASANMMFGLPPFLVSEHVRNSRAELFGEYVATLGLLLAILMCVRFRPEAVAYVVAAYITAAYWFTSSTSFANPAVTLARSLTDTFSGIRPADVPAFALAQILGGASAVGIFSWMTGESPVPLSGDRAPARGTK